MASVLERKAWSCGEPDANSEVPQKQKEKYLHPDAAIWVVKSSSLKRIQDAVLLFSHSTHFPYLGREKSPQTRDGLQRVQFLQGLLGHSRGCFQRLLLTWHAPGACVSEAVG